LQGEFAEQPSPKPLFAGASALGIAMFAALALIAFSAGHKNASAESTQTFPGPAVQTHEAPIPTDTPVPQLATPVLPTPVLPTPIATEVPPLVIPEAPANRLDCAQIRATGTYLSDEERAWFLANCVQKTSANARIATPVPTPITTLSPAQVPVSTPSISPQVSAQHFSSLVGLTVTGGHGSSHSPGEVVTLCYTAKKGQYIRVYNQTTNGVFSAFPPGVDKGAGKCVNLPIALPAGVKTIRIDAMDASGTKVLEYATISILVVP
jgi:hypothetical protein